MPVKTIYHRMKGLNTRMMKNYRHGIGPTRVVMLLTTIGRKSCLPRQTPLQYEEVDGDYYIASARGRDADWFKNIVANPKVLVQMGFHLIRNATDPVTLLNKPLATSW
ncbi:MAG: nitroreductase family deazaflavin-dependent oxidoreductase [Anaerolineales bacterium]